MSTILDILHVSPVSFILCITFQDESILIWYSGRKEKQLKLSDVTKIIPGQRTVSLCTLHFFFFFFFLVKNFCFHIWDQSSFMIFHCVDKIFPFYVGQTVPYVVGYHWSLKRWTMDSLIGTLTYSCAHRLFFFFFCVCITMQLHTFW